jgi:hypothetical protein
MPICPNADAAGTGGGAMIGCGGVSPGDRRGHADPAAGMRPGPA